ncbi:MAG: hypothetical protein GY861_03790 [bacterium]|nr:hypothetical protein [bacterium]
MTDYSPKALAKRFPVKYAQDSQKKRITLGDLVQEYVLLREIGCTSEESVDFIDREFLFGTWGEYSKNLPNQMLRDIRGFIHHVYDYTKEL